MRIACHAQQLQRLCFIPDIIACIQHSWQLRCDSLTRPIGSCTVGAGTAMGKGKSSQL